MSETIPLHPAALRAHFRCGEVMAKGGNLNAAREAFDRARPRRLERADGGCRSARAGCGREAGVTH